MAKPLVLGVEVGPGMSELRCVDVQIRREVSEGGWRASSTNCSDSDAGWREILRCLMSLPHEFSAV